MAESKVASIKAMVHLRHIDAPLAGLHRSFENKYLGQMDENTSVFSAKIILLFNFLLYFSFVNSSSKLDNLSKN